MPDLFCFMKELREASDSEHVMVDVVFHALAGSGEAVGRVQENQAESVAKSTDVDSKKVHIESGRTVFSLGGAPGESAQIRLNNEKSNFARGKIELLHEVSRYRVTAPCPYFGVVNSSVQQSQFRPEDGCGGCQWQHIEYSMQLESKRDIVLQALRRIGGLGEKADALVEKCVPSLASFHYRNKADLVVLKAEGKSQIGFRARESHKIIDIVHCPIQSDGNNIILRALRETIEQKWYETDEPNLLRRAVLRTSSRGMSLLVLETSRDWPQAALFAQQLMEKLPLLRGILQRQNDENARHSRFAVRTLAGCDWLEEEFCGLKWRVWGDDFFQVNTSMTPILLQTALDLGDVQRKERVLDLYCGVGLFSVAIARLGAQVTGIEGNTRAIEYARTNAKINHCEVDFLAGDVASALRKRRLASTRSVSLKSEKTSQVDVVVLDPPRAGAKDCLSEIVALRPRRIVYVSCDPATLARDVRVLQQSGFQLKRAVPLDLFPQTSHVETVVQLDAS